MSEIFKNEREKPVKIMDVAGNEEKKPDFITNLESFVNGTAFLRVKTPLTQAKRDDIERALRYWQSTEDSDKKKEKINFLTQELKREVFAEKVTDAMREHAESEAYTHLNNGDTLAARTAFKRLIKLEIVLAVEKNIDKEQRSFDALANARQHIETKFSNIKEALEALEDIDFQDVFRVAEETGRVIDLLQKYLNGTITNDEKVLLQRIDKAARGLVYRGNTTLGDSIPEEYWQFVRSLSIVKRREIEDRLEGATGSSERFDAEAHNPIKKGEASRPRRANDDLEPF